MLIFLLFIFIHNIYIIHIIIIIRCAACLKPITGQGGTRLVSGTKVLIRELSSAVPGSFHSRAATGTATASCVLSVNSPWQAKYVKDIFGSHRILMNPNVICYNVSIFVLSRHFEAKKSKN